MVTKSMLAEGLEFIINPYDEFALEEAFKLKEANGGDAVAVGVGDPYEIVPALIDGLNCHVSNRVAVEAVH
jgi:electron transfer flavoprotein beta subunit